MYIYSVTKYNPDTRGKIDEWIDMSCIGDTYDGIVFTLEEYLRVEANYIEAIERMMDDLGVKTLTVSYLERRFHDYAYHPSSRRAFNALYPIRMRDMRKKNEDRQRPIAASQSHPEHATTHVKEWAIRRVRT